MIVSVEELKKHITTDIDDSVLEAKLQALEISIRRCTNNNFQVRGIRTECPVLNQKLYTSYPLLKKGDTIQISGSYFNDEIYVIKDITDDFIELDRELIDEAVVMITKVVYPMDVKMGAVEIIKWKLKNEAANSGDTSKKDIQSETISRHSVTYVQDSTEADIDQEIGAPKKYTTFLKNYRKARF